jgi:hypothetical protein
MGAKASVVPAIPTSTTIAPSSSSSSNNSNGLLSSPITAAIPSLAPSSSSSPSSSMMVIRSDDRSTSTYDERLQWWIHAISASYDGMSSSLLPVISIIAQVHSFSVPHSSMLLSDSMQ